MSNRNEIVPTKREVIENRLLTALDDKTKVAILLTEEDLDSLIAYLFLANTNRMVMQSKCSDWIKDLNELKNSAFPK